MPVIDMGAVKDGFEPLPDGDYPAVFTEFQYVAKSASSGQPYLKMVYTVDDGENDGRKLFRNRSLQPQALFGLKQDVVALGADPEDWSGEVDVEEALSDLVGNACVLRVIVREISDKDGEPKMTNEVTKVLSSE